MTTVPVLTRSLAISMMLAFTAPLLAQAADAPPPPAGGKELRAEKWQEKRAAHLTADLNELANRLQLTASQQAAWDQYKAARAEMLKLPHYHMTPQENAADIAKMRAMRAEQMAQLLDNLSTATGQLRAALQPNQQQVLDEYAHQQPKRMREAMKKMREHRHREQPAG
ncbi:Spy/CpxP family protein refolding chaperone [Halothiobacillus sp. DCM-1]|uniref:Spy/CpxP family protein refolding chaperone n=1 Tax=Halothiobacillus sp. DCM-1 TaxID=3112558 RepID=UPI00324EDAA4